MRSHNHIDAALNDLAALYWLDGLCAEVSAIHRQHNQPDVPESDISRVPRLLPFLKPANLGPLSGYEQLARDAYNNGVKAAYRCVGWEHVGLLTAIANETRGTPEWNAYYAEAVSAIDTFFKSGSAWVEFDSYILEPAQEYLK
ncbi:hypothetical protein LP414_13230 [Polaromonas sp. P1(28)-13]|nr:hypothetical protein LP414_13230 [Polaromonas sp. P1(28)-13]